jgi:flagellar hook-associated protein FlgK
MTFLVGHGYGSRVGSIARIRDFFALFKITVVHAYSQHSLDFIVLFKVD